jgi:uncharacterized protein
MQAFLALECGERLQWQRKGEPGVEHIREQLEQLRKRIAKIDRKYAEAPPRSEPELPPLSLEPIRYDTERYLDGEEVSTEHGCHWELERMWARHRRHGSMDISTLQELPPDLLDVLSKGEAPACPPARWAFLDTETTGLAGGTGTHAFLVGVGRITAAGFHLRQFFMRDYAEEASLLHRLAEYLAEFDVLVTYNGKTYDVPLLETRFLMARQRTPFSRLAHVDLLHGARRLWKLRYESCKLTWLENQVLGVEREGDLPGEMIPLVYFDYLRNRQAEKLVPILHHNAIDILTLACLAAIVPWAFRSPQEAPLYHGAEMVGLGRWLRQAEQWEDAVALFRRAVASRMSDELLFRTLWDLALLEKKLGRQDAAVKVLADLAASPNPYRGAALEELAKHYERHEKNLAMALEMTEAALNLNESEALRKREARLRSRLARRAGGRQKPLL